MEVSLIQNLNHRTGKRHLGIQPAVRKLESLEAELNVPSLCHPPKLGELQWTDKQ